jgi:hypothetical protein
MDIRRRYDIRCRYNPLFVCVTMNGYQTYVFRVARGPFVEEFYQCVTFGAYTETWQEPLYSCLTVLLMYILPLVTMVTAYILIFTTIARKSRDYQINGNDVTNTCSAHLTSSRRLTINPSSLFIVCFRPFACCSYGYSCRLYSRESINIDTCA